MPTPQATACSVIGDRSKLSATPHSPLDWMHVGHRCGPRAFEVQHTSRSPEPHSQQKTRSTRKRFWGNRATLQVTRLPPSCLRQKAGLNVSILRRQTVVCSQLLILRKFRQKARSKEYWTVSRPGARDCNSAREDKVGDEESRHDAEYAYVHQCCAIMTIEPASFSRCRWGIAMLNQSGLLGEMKRRLGASACEQRAGEKERGISLTPCQDDRPYAIRRSRVTGHRYSPLLIL